MGRNTLGLVVLLAVLAWVPAGSAGVAAKKARSIPDVTILFGRALERVRHADHGTFAKAVVLEAEGYTHGTRCTSDGCRPGRPARKATGVAAWEFILQNSTAGSPYQSVVVDYGPSPRHFGTVIGEAPPFLEDVPIRHAPKMTLARAITRLRRAGYRSRFVSVTLRDPLGPKRVNPMYFFGFANKPFVAVDTRTGKVTRVR